MADDDSTARNALELAAFRSAALMANLTPGPMAQFMSGVAGNGFALAMREKREMVERHLRRADPSLTGWRLRRAVQQAFDSYARYWVESFRLPNLSKRVVERGFELMGYEHIAQGLDRGNGVILALPHLGGWEWAGRWMTEQGHPLTVVVEKLDNGELFEWFRELRAELGMTVVPVGPDAANVVAKTLRANGVVCLLCDRDIQGGGIEVEFFGEVTTLPAGPAMLALRTGAALLPTGVYFTDRYNGHVGVVRPPVPAVKHGGGIRADVQRITQALARELEFLIRRAPEQWHLFQPNWPSDPGYGE